jgi:hypothetical protein
MVILCGFPKLGCLPLLNDKNPKKRQIEMLISSPLKSWSFIFIAGYLLFMSLAMDSSMLDALVFYVTEHGGKAVCQAGNVKLGSLKDGLSVQPVLQFMKNEKADSRLAASSSQAHSLEASSTEITASTDVTNFRKHAATREINSISPASALPKNFSSVASHVRQAFAGINGGEGTVKTGNFNYFDENGNVSIPRVIKGIQTRNWTYDPLIDRYVVRYDSDVTAVLSLRPSLQTLVENVFKRSPCKLGAALLQDPMTGAVLALASYNGSENISPASPQYITDNWALKATFPIASIFKIITAAAAIERLEMLPESSVQLGKKYGLELWKAFALSHNGVFGVVGKKLGKPLLQYYTNAFGFNRQFFFDIPVETSKAEIPEVPSSLGSLRRV